MAFAPRENEETQQRKATRDKPQARQPNAESEFALRYLSCPRNAANVGGRDAEHLEILCILRDLVNCHRFMGRRPGAVRRSWPRRRSDRCAEWLCGSRGAWPKKY